jgi:hypothetical protein
MLMYLITLMHGDGTLRFSGTFSDQDVRRLHLMRQGQSFDLDNFKAYVDGNGNISLAKKPDYREWTTLKYSELWRSLTEARVAQHY